MKTNFVMNVAEALFYLLSGTGCLGWALLSAAELSLKFHGSLQSALMRNSGEAALVLALAVLSVVAIYAAIQALRGKSLPAPSASVLLITAAALRSLEILTRGAVTVPDANILGLVFGAAALLYFGASRLWWCLLMPLAAAASFSPLVWLEFFRGAKTGVLLNAISIPLGAFLLGNLLIVLRELRLRARTNVSGLEVMQLRTRNTMAQLRAMESDLKSLKTILSGERADLTPLATTQFDESAPVSIESSDACSFDEIDALARRLLDEARAGLAGRSVRLSLTAPTSGSLPIAVRGNLATLAAWMKSSILNAIESVGGFPDGAVRVILKPGLASLSISVEDNGRGFGESLLSKKAQAADRLTLMDVRAGVERAGGRFDIQARLGVGSRLSIELPRIDAFASSPRIAAATRLASFQEAAAPGLH